MESVLGTPLRFDGLLISQQPMTAIINQTPIMICEYDRQYTVGELERQQISIESDASGALGRPLRLMTTMYNAFGSQDRVAAKASRITSAHAGGGGRLFSFTELINPPAITSQYSLSARPLEQSGVRCKCGRHLAAVSAGSSPVEISCSYCGRRYFEIVRELGKNQY
ncbi:unnamed protein product [Rodentolepis nana]|uniref:Zinc-ribbon domain-containing protein n=1 Tax=Rodentolepis nana TaxID=102285 RepID=A0A0R3TJ16_RODNA|nr:unnamed protein product [Rodentolepis nana]